MQTFQSLTLEQAADLLEDAICREQTIDGGRRAINFGIDAAGREFVLIHDALEGARLGYL